MILTMTLFISFLPKKLSIVDARHVKGPSSVSPLFDFPGMLAYDLTWAPPPAEANKALTKRRLVTDQKRGAEL